MGLLTANGKPLLAVGRLLSLAVAGTLPDPEIPGNGTITVAEPINYTVYQHLNNSRVITASATFTGDVTLVEVRAVPISLTGVLDTANATAWTPISTNTSTMTASGNAQIIEGGWYVWQARDSIKTGITGSGANRFGVGEVILWIGQSNAENSPETPDKYPNGDPRAVEYIKTKVLRRVGRYADQKPPNTLFSGTGGYGDTSTGQGSTGDGYVFFANLLSQGRNVPVMIVQRAEGGTSIEQWLATNGLLDGAIAAVNEVGGDCGMAIWYQGEANADNATSEASYRTSLGTLHTKLKTAFGRNNTNFKVGIVALAAISNSSYTDGTETQVPAIRRAQIGYANETAGAFLAATGCDLYTGDAVHLHKTGYSVSGRRQVKSALAALGIGTTGAGPKIASASRSGLTVDVTIAHTGGTSLLAGDGGSGNSLTGFRFFDNGIALTAAPVGIINATTIRFTLSAAPTGVLTMDYAQTNAPYHADPTNSRVPAVAASIVYDNAYYHGSSITAPFALSTLGCPLQPCALINVTGG